MLPAVLESYSRLEVPSGGWKLVVVDNASTDGSNQIIRSFQDRLPLTYLFEPQDGKNAALNAGLEFASGDLLVFTDDDAFPRADWLLRLREAADARPTFSIFGGLVVPRWETAPPDWILNWVRLGPTFTISDAHIEEGPIHPAQVFGPNMAVRADVFRAGHRFDTTIGPRRSGRYPMGSETELVQRLIRLGGSAWHVHGAIVEHFVRANQMRPGWIINRALRFGRGRYRLRGRPAQALPCWCGVPRYLFRRMAGETASVLGAALRGNAENLFHSCWELSYLCGQAIEARAIGKERRPLS